MCEHSLSTNAGRGSSGHEFVLQLLSSLRTLLSVTSLKRAEGRHSLVVNMQVWIRITLYSLNFKLNVLYFGGKEVSKSISRNLGQAVNIRDNKGLFKSFVNNFLCYKFLL